MNKNELNIIVNIRRAIRYKLNVNVIKILIDIQNQTAGTYGEANLL